MEKADFVGDQFDGVGYGNLSQVIGTHLSGSESGVTVLVTLLDSAEEIDTNYNSTCVITCLPPASRSFQTGASTVL